jgi:hypothetical protein
MPTEQMSINERRTYLQMMLPHYTAANRFVQSQLLDVSHCVVAGGACQMPTLILLLTEIIGLSQEAAMGSVEEFGELAVQTHAMYCLWMMDKGKVHTPPAWYTASLKHNWNAPHGMPSD